MLAFIFWYMSPDGEEGHPRNLATQPGVHFYSGHMMTPMTGRGGKQFPVYGAFALETEAFPDAVNQKGFPSMILRPGETHILKR